MLALWQLIVLGALQGLTEFLPVSSSGHLVLVQQWMGLDSPHLLFYDVFFHAGTLVAVLVYFRRDLWQLTRHLNQAENRKMALWIFLGSIPTALIGFLAKDLVETLVHSAKGAALGLLVTALFLTLATRIRLKTPPMWLAAILIGVIQGVAVLPGVSRSGSTIALALILSLGYGFAFRFSFLLSIPAVGGAFLLELLQLPGGELPVGLIASGVVTAALFGLLALWLLERIMKRERLHLFALYCALLAVVVLGIIL